MQFFRMSTSASACMRVQSAHMTSRSLAISTSSSTTTASLRLRSSPSAVAAGVLGLARRRVLHGDIDMHAAGAGFRHRHAGDVGIVLAQHLEQPRLHRHRQQAGMFVRDAGHDVLVDRVPAVQDRRDLDDMPGRARRGIAGELRERAFVRLLIGDECGPSMTKTRRRAGRLDRHRHARHQFQRPAHEGRRRRRIRRRPSDPSTSRCRTRTAGGAR